VKSTEDAARCLLANWPTGGKGKAYMAAQEACLSALEGITSPVLAREAFITAALAAKIHIRSTDDPRATAMDAGKNRMSVADSPAFRKANHDAMEAGRRIFTKIKAARKAFARNGEGRN
jgi:uncharacterized membrane protein